MMKRFLLFTIAICIFEAVSARKQIKVACIGNSITYGTGITDREKYSYPVQLQNLLGNNYFVKNFGKPGATLLRRGHRPYMQQREFLDAMTFGADIAVIHLGINDTDPRDWPNYRDEFVRDDLALIDSLKSSNKKIRFILAQLTPITYTHPRFISGTKKWHDEIQEAIATVAEVSEAELIDFHEPLYPYPYLLPDAVHPDAEGAGILAKTVYSAITGDYGGLQLSGLYADNMILQRNIPLKIQGIANAATEVIVEIGGQKAIAMADNRGRWSVTLQPLKAGSDYILSIKAGTQKRIFHHVAVGEVWLCSGQSNMQFMLQQAITAKEDIPSSTDNDLRLYNMKGRWNTTDAPWTIEVLDSVNHLLYFRNTGWEEASPATTSTFSAVAYYFGKMLRDSLKIPIGLMCNAVGGSPAEAWIDRNTLETKFQPILKDWLHNDFIQEWVRNRARVNLKSKGRISGRHPYEPCYLFESGIKPLYQFPIQGVIWYQGESNAHNFETHETLFRLLVDSWRNNWNRKDMPFYFVQLSSLDRPSWPWFRNSQLQLMKSVPYTGMAVSSDRGDSLDVHPRFKKEIGERLGRWALCVTYNKNITPSGPLFRSAQKDHTSIIISFDYADGLSTSDGKEPSCFEIAEFEGLYYPAKAVIEKDKVRLTSSRVKNPKYVRYAWQPFTRANLINKEALPASTFKAKCE